MGRELCWAGARHRLGSARVAANSRYRHCSCVPILARVAPCAWRRFASFCCASVREGADPYAFPDPWRGFCHRRYGCGLDRALRPLVRPRPRASSVRCWLRCRPTVPRVDRNCALASTMRLTMPNKSKVQCARRSMRVTITTSPGRGR